MAEVTVTNNTDEKRYEAREGDRVAGFAAYIPAGELLVFSHTEVIPAFEGQGVGSALARAGLDDARARGLRVMPLCPFIHAFISRHPDYVDLVYNAPPSKVTD